MIKPCCMKIRQYAARVAEMNEYLTLFPPIAANQELPNDEILEIENFSNYDGLQTNEFNTGAYYKDETGIQAIIDEFSTHVSTNQLASGGIMTQDFGWGSSENASSISQTILGLISCSVDPTGTDFTKGTNNLVSRLVEFQVANGLFDWVLTDETADDPAFSTPQAFLALATYQTYSNHNEAINPFDFN